MALRDAMRLSDMESMDVELRSFLAVPDNTVASAVQNLASAWRNGHAAVRAATSELDVALSGVGIEMGHAARTALSTRLAGPGAHPGLIDEVSVWMAAREKAVLDGGFAIEPRALALTMADRVEVDPYLKLDQPSPADRVRAIGNVLWPWGESAQSVASYNPYAPILAATVDVVRDNWAPPIQVIDIGTWTDQARQQVHDELVRAREVIVRVAAVERRTLRTALLDLTTVPVEVGPLMFHPQVTAVSDHGAHAEARVLLREAWL